MRFALKLCSLVVGVALATHVSAVTNRDVASSNELAQRSAAANGSSLSEDAFSLQQILKGMVAFNANFKQTVSDFKGQEISHSVGTIAIARPRCFIMHTTNPDESVLFIKNGDIYFYDEVVNQVTIYSMKQFKDNPFKLLTEASEKDFEEYLVSRDGTRYTLIPNNSSDINSITLSFENTPIENDAGNTQYLLESISIRMDDGNTNYYRFLEANARSNQCHAEYSLPSDVEIDDERNAR